ncbi:MAG TPA: aromatic ring-hydroxylating dioxygenase subunit alpha [Gemmatimonadales bacterium]|nr:aromatic ring-hydroxylating dioxygenase subunit alpha [Gemmatimonadales bacterium]
MLEPTLPRFHYLDPAAFEREKERIFFREWVCAGRGEEVPNPGDYLLLDIVGESILLVRDRDGSLKAHYNVCRHRGSQLVLGVEPKPAGESSRVGCSGSFTSGIRCPYHAWTYNLDGALRTAPYLEATDALCKEDLPLYRVDVAEWGGFVFLNLGASGTSDDPSLASPGTGSPRPTLAEQLGGAPERVQRYPLAELRIAQRISYEVAANWKVILENYNECYHCGTVHPELCKVVPAFKQKGGAELDWERGVPHREGAWTFTMTGTTSRKPFAGLNEDELVRHKGELIYPNFMLSLSAEHAAAFTLWPHGPECTTVICDFLFHPDEMSRPDFNPADAVEFWDITNRQDWVICESVQRGMRSRVFTQGFYAPMEVLSLDIRKWLEERLGP